MRRIVLFLRLIRISLGISAAAAISLLISNCTFLPISDINPAATPTPVIISQWAADAVASSQYAVPDWSARRMIGPAEINQCIDDSRAWSSSRGNGIEWVELAYERPVFVSQVRVYQNYGRGAIIRITLVDESDENHVVWEGQDTVDPCPGILAVSLPDVTYHSSKVRIDLDESRYLTWNQIDAVQIIGSP